MKGWELLNELANLNVDELNLEVHTEGCDCHGVAGDVKIFEDTLFGENDSVILIKREADD